MSNTKGRVEYFWGCWGWDEGEPGSPCLRGNPQRTRFMARMCSDGSHFALTAPTGVRVWRKYGELIAVVWPLVGVGGRLLYCDGSLERWAPGHEHMPGRRVT